MSAKFTPGNWNIPISVRKMIAELPPGLGKAIMHVLADHIGRDKAIGRAELINALVPLGFDHRRQDRPVRLAINQLRKDGAPICSTGGVNGGYFLAAGPEELDEYLAAEVHSRAMDLLEQERAMRQGAARLWGGPTTQPPLF